MAGVTIPIVALDFPTAERARAMVDLLGDSCDFYKVGSELFTAAGPKFVESLINARRKVFLDLKLHDIPNTVARAMSVISSMGVSIATVHASGGRAMIEAAVEAAGRSCGVFAVTVLTSLDAGALREVNGDHSSPADTVMRLADLASSSGARGIVCSGEEISIVRERFGAHLELLVPGIRLQGDDAADQSRIITPERAAAEGADYIVLGRTVTASKNPGDTMTQIRAAIKH